MVQQLLGAGEGRYSDFGPEEPLRSLGRAPQLAFTKPGGQKLVTLLGF